MSQTNRNRLKLVFDLVEKLPDSYIKDDLLRLKQSWKDEEELTRRRRTKYGLRNKHTKLFAKIQQTENTGDDTCCGNYTWSLSENFGDKTWWTKSPLHAIQTLYAPQQWYNSSYENPVCYFNPEDYEIVSNYGDVINIKPLSRYVYGKMYDYTHSKPKRKCKFYAEQFKTKTAIKKAKNEYLCWADMKYHVKWLAHALD